MTEDEVYFNRYKNYLKWFNDSVLTENAINTLIDKYYNLIEPYATGENGEQKGYTYLDGNSSFTNARTALKTHISNRKVLVKSYVQ